MGKRKQIDWEAIEKQYRMGQFSVRAIARNHTIQPSSITRKATKLKWQRDHADEIRQRTKATLQSNSESNTPTREDIDKAVQVGVDVIREHRKDIQAGRSLVLLLSSQLDQAAQSREDLEDQIYEDTKGHDGIKADAKRRNAMLKAVSLPSHASVLKDLSTTLKNLIPLERQAFNLDEPGATLEDVIAALPKQFRDGVRAALTDALS